MPVNPILGTDDDDNLFGTAQRDLIRAGGGQDWVVLQGGRDTVHGEDGNDSVFGYFGGDRLFGGAGDDQLVASSFDGGTGHLFGGAGNDAIFVGDPVNLSFGGRGDDRVTVYFDQGGAAFGGSGIDRLFLYGMGLDRQSQVSDATVILNGAGATASAHGSILTLTGFEALTIMTGEGNDLVRGGDLADDIDVRSGANTVLALGGDDAVSYLAGAANTLDGGDGYDRLGVVHYGARSSLSFSVTNGVAVDGLGSVLTGFEVYDVSGGHRRDLVLLGAGNDVFQGFNGRDIGQGNDGRDRLDGGKGHDTLFGGAGRDVVIGGLDQDELTGGAGADAFVFHLSGDLGDRITDMQSGVDVIRLQAAILGGALGRGGVDASQFSVDAAVGTNGQFVLRASAEAGFNELIWDANGSDAGLETRLVLVNATASLSAADLLIV